VNGATIKKRTKKTMKIRPLTIKDVRNADNELPPDVLVDELSAICEGERWESKLVKLQGQKRARVQGPFKNTKT
jgi:hypothetical protein